MNDAATGSNSEMPGSTTASARTTEAGDRLVEGQGGSAPVEGRLIDVWASVVAVSFAGMIRARFGRSGTSSPLSRSAGLPVVA